MPLEIIGAGYGRTGTMSLQHALNELGYRCYHMDEVLRNRDNRGHLAFWRRVADDPTAPRNWEEVFAGYRAAVDNPAVCVWPQLLAAYPEAKVVLTQHPKGPDAWFDSVMETLWFTDGAWQFRVVRAVLPLARTFGDMVHLLVWQHLHQGTMPDRARATERYRRHVEEVRAAVPSERLLVFTVTDGWEPLCAFLGVPVPETEFPNVNDRATVRRLNTALSALAYTVLGGAALGTAYGVRTLVRALR